jgi:hypothetical protein
MSAEVVIIAAAVFLFGVFAGVVFITSVAIHREERDFRRTGRLSMTRPAPDRVSYGTRLVVGLSIRRPELEPVAMRYLDTVAARQLGTVAARQLDTGTARYQDSLV